MALIKDISGLRFGRLEVISLCNYRNKDGRALWKCKCDCGNEIIVSSNSLLRKNTRSCGCYKNDIIKQKAITHNDSKSKLYKIWVSMKKRCQNSNDKGYKNYGGRGITVCNLWKNSYEEFKRWSLKNGYKQGLSIDRIDNNSGYSPENCRWVTTYIQSRNTRRTHFIEYNGKKYVMKDLAEKLGIKYNTFANRILVYKFTLEEAINKPIKRKNLKCEFL